jgi:ankyrin repeat protein
VAAFAKLVLKIALALALSQRLSSRRSPALRTLSTMTTQTMFSCILAGDIEALRRLLDGDPGFVHAHHADPDDDSTTLQFAAAKGQLPICKLLVERGAEVYTNPTSTYPPVILAAWNRHQHIVDYFLREIPDQAQGTNRLGVTINLAARQGWLDLVNKHIAADPLSVHQRGWIGDTPLHWPAHNGFVEIVEVLLDAGAVIEADEINCYGGKPLHWASEHAPQTVELLLRRGADVNSRNLKADSEFYGMTPLIMNATQKNDCAEVTELLLAAGADLRAVDAKGKTALDYAVEYGLHRIEGVLRGAHRD